MSKTKRRVKTEAEEEETPASYNRDDPISDATVVQPTRTMAFGLGDLRPIIVPDPTSVFPARNIEESPEFRTRRFRDLHLIAHRGGVMACSHCHFAPYYCQCCGGRKCRCTVAGVYRHWEFGVPCASMDEQKWLDEVSL